MIWEELLHKQNIKSEQNLDATFGVFDSNILVATASIYKNIIKCVAVDDKFKGGAIFNELLSEVFNEIYNLGHRSIYVYTKPDSVISFKSIGFTEIESVEDKLVFMERSTKGFSDYLENLKKYRQSGEKIGAIVLNANPFSKGHLALIETAYKKCDILHLFVVSEDMSVFPADIRKELVIQGTSHLNNVFVHDTDSYLVSSATFPSYFLKEDEDVTKIQATLDSKIFKYSIAPVLGITDRFVGEEPFSKATQSYNNAMEEVFLNGPLPNTPKLHIIKRLEINEIPVSASEIRKKLGEGKLEEVKGLVPKSTMDFLLSERAYPILKTLQTDIHKGIKHSDR